MLSINEIKKIPLVFIVGQGRSGTSLMQTILDGHPNVLSCIESPFVIHLKKDFSQVKQWTPARINDFIDSLYKDKRFKLLWNIERHALEQTIAGYPLSELDFPSLCKIVYLSFPSPFAKDRITVLVDKNPIYSIFIPQLLGIFPDAKFIHLVRDYRDKIVSSRKAFQQYDTGFVAGGWVIYNTLISDFKNKYPAKFYTLRYEDLVSDPQKTVPDICAFMSVGFYPQMLDFHGTTREAYREKNPLNDIMQKIHAQLFTPIHTGQINKWKTDLSHKDLVIADYIAGACGRRYGYEPSTHERSAALYIRSIIKRARYTSRYKAAKLYYSLPIALRDLLRNASYKVFSWFGLASSLNKAEMEYNK